MAKGSKKEEASAPEVYEEVLSAPEQQEEEIRRAAYYLWELKGRKDGSDVEDWIEAEEIVND
ncbi:MAG: DUF2934 domain-containing protein [Chlorobiaceae bacterium]|nr:DUF2934 domain-containing protein [Chlorobiaceae bacterium]